MEFSVKFVCTKCKKTEVLRFNGSVRILPPGNGTLDLTVVKPQMKEWRQCNDQWFCNPKCHANVVNDD